MVVLTGQSEKCMDDADEYRIIGLGLTKVYTLAADMFVCFQHGMSFSIEFYSWTLTYIRICC